MNDNFITITKERYYQLIKADVFLRVLHVHGVDDWEGYEISLDSYNEMTEALQNANQTI